MVNLRAHELSVALVHPQIAPNTGNIARLCVATGTPLHIVRPMGFVLSDQNIKRSAMDYWPRLQITLHDDLDAFTHVANERPMWFFDSVGKRSLFDTDFSPTDTLVFGSETRGLPPELLSTQAERVVRIPQVGEERCLNLSSAVAAALFHALYKIRK